MNGSGIGRDDSRERSREGMRRNDFMVGQDGTGNVRGISGIGREFGREHGLEYHRVGMVGRSGTRAGGIDRKERNVRNQVFFVYLQVLLLETSSIRVTAAVNLEVNS